MANGLRPRKEFSFLFPTKNLLFSILCRCANRGVEVFTTVFQSLGKDLPLIVEDLGGLSEEVFHLRDQFHLTGIRILQFGFSFHPDNIYRPHNYIPNSIAYTSTHDNPTVIGWWNDSASEDEKKTLIKYIQYPKFVQDEDQYLLEHLNQSINWYLIQMAMATVANVAVTQFQDLLGLDNRSRMNDPALCKYFPRVFLSNREPNDFYLFFSSQSD